jgi:UDP:flavonoid glycosyltransferase YjiC (YdhE family)
VILDYALPLARQVLADAYQACLGADAIIHSLLMTIAGHQIARELDRPDFSAMVFAVFTPTATFPNPGFPVLPLGGGYNRLTHLMFDQINWRVSQVAYAWLRRQQPELPRLSTWPFSAANRRPTPILYGFSPLVIPKPPDWGHDAHVTGYWFLDTGHDWQPPAALADFLEGGPPPVYIGFGSMISRQAAKLTEVALEALAHTGQRGVLQAGWGGLVTEDLPPDVFRLDSAPFDWLFPRMAAAVHHGGIGTTSESLRAGIPTTIVPFTADQPFWGRQVYRLGVGPKPIPHRQLTAQNLAETLLAMTTDPAMRRRAAELGQRIRSEDGVTYAVQVMERYLLWH